MVEDEVVQLLDSSDDVADDWERLVNQFRRGRSALELVALLDSGRSDVVSMGAWILGELPFELYSCEEILSRLWELTGHRGPDVRFHALGALFPALDWRDESTRRLLSELRLDSNEGVRRMAIAAIAQLTGEGRAL